MSRSRRTFLKGLSAVAALGVVASAPRRLLAVAPVDLLPEPDEALLRELALVAVDAARAAGATFADVRVAAGRQVGVRCTADWMQGQAPRMEWPGLTVTAEYGVRAIVDGAWGFAGASDLTPDAVRSVALEAVARARSNRPRRPRTLELAPVSRATKGTWATPIEQDPFGVPVGEQAAVALAALVEAGRVRGLDRATVDFLWTRHVRVFASSEGALVEQHIAIAAPGAWAGVNRTPHSMEAFEGVEALQSGPYGYETLTRVDLKTQLRQAAERAVAESRRPLPPSADVGRYDIVFGAPAVASLLSSTLTDALNLERALGYRANREGTSFAAPPGEILGQYRVGSPLLAVRADRTRAHGAATVGWDDEGVPAGEHTLIKDGIVVDYLTDRQTAAELAPWYRAQGETVRSHGCASGVGQIVPTVHLPNITMQPGKDTTSVEDLIADTKQGFYIERSGAASDQQVLNTQGWTSHRSVRQIWRGKLGGRVRDLGFQFVTPSFWRSMDTIGGAGSLVETVDSTGFDPLLPLQLPFASVAAVPARFRAVNVLNYGRTA